MDISPAVDRVQKSVEKIEEAIQKGDPTALGELTPALTQSIETLKSLTEIEKSRAETLKLSAEEAKTRYDLAHAAKHERSEARQRYATILGSVVTTMMLIVTLGFQAYQFRRSEEDKRVAAEDAQWSEAVKTVSQASKMSPIAIALSPFLKSKRYAEQAHKTAVQALVGTSDSIVFADLFREAFVPVDWKNLGAVLQLDRALGPRAGKLYTKTYDEKTQKNNNDLLTTEERQQLEYITAALSTIGTAVAPLLRASRPPGEELDLRGAWFQDADWSGADLHDAKIDNLDLRFSILKGADLSGIQSFNGIYLFGTAWWEAGRISPELLEHLVQAWPYKEGFGYGPQEAMVAPQQYSDAITRLKNNQSGSRP
jgi:Pentapeptide repeats (8 copies)